MMKKFLVCALAAWAGAGALAYEYDVSEPKIRPQFKGAEAGVWTLDRAAAFAQAKAEGRFTLVLFTGSWWCPYCHTIEDTVLTRAKWKNYVAEKGFYLVEQDYSYRYEVPEGQEWKSYRPDMPPGWGFKCWYMNPGFLAAAGLTEEEGLKAIQEEYVYQGEMALPGATPFTMKTWDGADEFTYGRIAYACIVVIDPDGNDIGRVDFPWHSTKNITAEEAQEFEIQSIERILNGSCELCSDLVGDRPDTSAANVYTGWLTDGAGVAGTAKFKLGKANARGEVPVSGSAKIAGRTVAFRAAKVKDFVAGATLEGRGWKAEITFGETGMSGSVTDGAKTYSLAGGRDVFKAKDEKAKARAAGAPAGLWNLVLKPTDATPAPFARGYGTLTLEARAKGKVRVSGTLADGTKVSLSDQLIVGENGVACVPVRADLYAKRGGLGFVLWFKEGRFLDVTDVSAWKAAGKNTFSAGYSVTTTLAPGFGTVEEEMDLLLAGFADGTTLGGRPVVEDPSFDMVSVSGRKWAGTELTGFKATANARTGALKGSFTFLTGDAQRPKKVRGTFAGAVMGGAGYGSVVVKGEGSWAVKVTPCGGCSDD